MQTLPNFPNFDSFAIVGDTRSIDIGPFTIRATIAADYDTRPTDFDCYEKEAIKAWNNDEWSFVGIVLSVWIDDVCLDKHAASIWGVDCNYPNSDNRHISEIADDCLPEAIATAEAIAATLRDKLAA